MSDTYDSIMGLRAIRSYTADQISDEHLHQILEAARWTGSSKNTQRWSFVVVRDPGQKDRLADCGDFTTPIRNAPMVIAIVMEPDGYEFDIGRAAQNIMLAADAIGVATCPITLHRDKDAAAVLGLGPGAQARYAVSLGYPSSDAAPAKFGGRKSADNVVHWDRYGG